MYTLLTSFYSVPRLVTRPNAIQVCRTSLKIQEVTQSIPFFFAKPQSNTTATERIFYRGAGKSLARPTSRCILLDGENTSISFDASLVLYTSVFVCVCIYIYIYIYIYIALIFL